MAGYAVGIRNGLITAEHRQRMGMRIWEFMWLVEHVTEEYPLPDGELRGKVLGGTSIDANRIAVDLGVHRDTVLDSLEKLELAGYIIRWRAPRGYRIEVCNSKKWTKTPTEGKPAPVRIGDSESGRIGGLPDSPTRRTSDSPIALDIAVPEDIAEMHPSIQEGDAAELWTRSVAAVVDQTSPGIAAALAACSPEPVDANTIKVALPSDPGLLQKAKMALPLLGTELRRATGRKIELVQVPYEARAGP